MKSPRHVVYMDQPFLVVLIAGQFYYRTEELAPFILMSGDQKKDIVLPTPPTVVNQA